MECARTVPFIFAQFTSVQNPPKWDFVNKFAGPSHIPIGHLHFFCCCVRCCRKRAARCDCFFLCYRVFYAKRLLTHTHTQVHVHTKQNKNHINHLVYRLDGLHLNCRCACDDFNIPHAVPIASNERRNKRNTKRCELVNWRAWST